MLVYLTQRRVWGFRSSVCIEVESRAQNGTSIFGDFPSLSPVVNRNNLGGCQNYDPFLGTLNTRCRIIVGIQKGAHNFDNHPYTL